MTTRLYPVRIEDACTACGSGEGQGCIAGCTATIRTFTMRYVKYEELSARARAQVRADVLAEAEASANRHTSSAASFVSSGAGSASPLPPKTNKTEPEDEPREPERELVMGMNEWVGRWPRDADD